MPEMTEDQRQYLSDVHEGLKDKADNLICALLTLRHAIDEDRDLASVLHEVQDCFFQDDSLSDVRERIENALDRQKAKWEAEAVAVK